MNQLQSTISPLAGKPAPDSLLTNIPRLVNAYYTEIPDPAIKAQQVQFGTSGHRGSAFEKTFNEAHILVITQAIVLYRIHNNITGPLFLGMDTHALSVPAFSTALEVLAAHGLTVMIAEKNAYTPTPVISHAILTYNQNRKAGFADGIVITPSHNPPNDGGFKYNPPHGGPADTIITQWIENKANELLHHYKQSVKRIPFERALRASTTHQYDYLNAYVNDLAHVVDMQAIAHANLAIGVNPLGGAGTHYWEPIAERYGLNLNLINPVIEPDFRFMSVDWDGQIRMDPSSVYAMANIIQEKDKFDLLLLCDTDYDRHGIITKDSGLMPPNHYLCAAIYYLFQHRPGWSKTAAVGKTIVSSQMIDRVSEAIDREIYEVPVGFKWFGEALLKGSVAFAGEESAGASFLRMDGKVWTTDKDGIICTLLAAEINAVTEKSPSIIYQELEQKLGHSFYERVDKPATVTQKNLLKNIPSKQIQSLQLPDDEILSILTKAPGNDTSIDGIKVITKEAWFALRPSGTEDIYKIYAESFKDEAHLQKILMDAETMIHNIFNSC